MFFLLFIKAKGICLQCLSYHAHCCLSVLLSADGTWPSSRWSSVTCWLKSKPSSLGGTSRGTLSGSPKLTLPTSGGNLLEKSKPHVAISSLHSLEVILTSLVRTPEFKPARRGCSHILWCHWLQMFPVFYPPRSSYVCGGSKTCAHCLSMYNCTRGETDVWLFGDLKRACVTNTQK